MAIRPALLARDARRFSDLAGRLATGVGHPSEGTAPYPSQSGSCRAYHQ